MAAEAMFKACQAPSPTLRTQPHTTLSALHNSQKSSQSQHKFRFRGLPGRKGQAHSTLPHATRTLLCFSMLMEQHQFIFSAQSPLSSSTTLFCRIQAILRHCSTTRGTCAQHRKFAQTDIDRSLMMHTRKNPFKGSLPFRDCIVHCQVVWFVSTKVLLWQVIT